MILADKIIYLRKKCAWSQEELAEKMNVSRQSISKWESGQSVPDLDKILKLVFHDQINRLFLYLASKTKHDWYDSLDVSKINVGSGVRIIDKTGVYDRQFNIIVEKLAMDGPFSDEIGEKIFEEKDKDEVILCLNYDGKFGLNNMNAYFQYKFFQ